jgi:pimeloyl-ACP methyl ester carboxylesterase
MITEQAVERVWSAYYDEFRYFSADLVRPGCEPRLFRQQPPSGRSVVLVHGLTDSPYFMLALGRFFSRALGYSVYLPLLQGHGLREPNGMAGVSLQEWKNNVEFAIAAAAAAGDRVSVGGLSTGGALTLHAACRDPRVTGDIYLFAAALGLYDFGVPAVGWLAEAILRRSFLHRLPEFRQLLGKNPYRYCHVPLGSARELALLMAELADHLDGYRGDRRLDKRVFAAWSAVDRVVKVATIDALAEHFEPGNFHRFVVPATENIYHAGVVLAEPVYAADADTSSEPLEKPNPHFAEMLIELGRFAGGGSS